MRGASRGRELGVDDLAQLHGLCANLLDQLTPAQRNQMLRRLSHDMRRSNQQRMAKQIGPDGAPWAPRKPRRLGRPATRPVRFLYRSSGQARLADMRSWVKQGKLMTGYDREAEGIRSFHEDRVETWLPGTGRAEPGRASKPSGRQRLAMFRGLRNAKHLRAGASGSEAWVEFTARASRLASIHHYGLRDRVSIGGPEVDYPERPLLGFSTTDEVEILNRFVDRAGEAMGWGVRAGR